MSSKDRLIENAKMRAYKLLPKNLVSRAFGVIAETELPAPARGVVNGTFARFAGINLSESERPPQEYKSLNAFFTRALKSNARPIATDDPSHMVSPVDGRITQFGPIDHHTLIQAKGKEYSLTELLDSAKEAADFSQGFYATIYLSPKDYHHIHSPISGDLSKASYIPGHLWPVNPLSVKNVERLFAINERLISFIEQPAHFKRVAVIKVGATCVGRIGLAFDDFQSNRGPRRRREILVQPPEPIAHGQELGTFNLGSTVILLIASPDFVFEPELVAGQMLRLGQPLGHIKST